MQIDITEEEREELVLLLDRALDEMRLEARRTRSREWRERLQSEQFVLSRLLERLDTHAA